MTPISEEFQEKLFALLREYDVEMSVAESHHGFASSVDGVAFYSMPKWNEAGDMVTEEIDCVISKWQTEHGK